MVRGLLVLVDGEAEVARWPLEVAGTVDLGIVDRLARVRWAAKRLGWEMRLAAVCPQVRELLDLAGLGDVVEMQR